MEHLLATVHATVERPAPLEAILTQVLNAVQSKSNTVAAIPLLVAFQKQVEAQVLLQNPTLANTLIAQAHDLVIVLSDISTKPNPGPASPTSLSRDNEGNLQLRFAGDSGTIYIIESSANLLDWKAVGLANEQTDGSFSFSHLANPNEARCFYRYRAH